VFWPVEIGRYHEPSAAVRDDPAIEKLRLEFDMRRWEQERADASARLEQERADAAAEAAARVESERADRELKWVN